MYVRAQGREKTQLVKAEKYMNLQQSLPGSFCTQLAQESHDTSGSIQIFFSQFSISFQHQARFP